MRPVLVLVQILVLVGASPCTPPCNFKPHERGRGHEPEDERTLSAAAAQQVCKTDLDCSLNGVCSPHGACSCDDGWIGSKCHQLDFLPVPVANGYDAEGNTSSWGGRGVFDPRTRKWHGLFSEFYGHCGAGQPARPATNYAVRAVSDTPCGPYTKSDIVLAPQTHNVEPHRDPVSGEWLLFHIGTGSAGGQAGKHQVCVNGSSNSAISPTPTSRFPIAGHTGTKPGSVMHHSQSPAGPWVPMDVFETLQPKWCRDKPAAFLAENGTVYLLAVCHSPGAGEGAGEGLPATMAAWRAPSWQGKFELLGNLTRSNADGEPQWSWVEPVSGPA